MRTTADGLAYPNKYYWDVSRNPYATVPDGLADCTCYCFGAVIEDGHRPVVSKVCNANSYHKYLINGWTWIPYEESKLEEGDIIEWADKCHVAMFVGDGISGSFYTGIHGQAYYDGKFDTRPFTSLKEMSDWMVANYPTRLFHHWSIEEESRWCGGSPNYILKHPLYSVKEDKSVNQIKVLSNDMNVRDGENNVLKRAESGFYNVLSWKEKPDYIWYEVEPDRFIAGYPGRVEFVPKQDEEIIILRKRIEELENILKEIHTLSEVD